MESDIPSKLVATQVWTCCSSCGPGGQDCSAATIEISVGLRSAATSHETRSFTISLTCIRANRLRTILLSFDLDRKTDNSCLSHLTQCICWDRVKITCRNSRWRLDQWVLSIYQLSRYHSVRVIPRSSVDVLSLVTKVDLELGSTSTVISELNLRLIGKCPWRR